MDWVASSKADYVEKAVAIATDDVLRNKLSREIVTARRLLQEDEEMVRELEHFFLKAVKELFLDDLALKNNSALLVFHVYFATD